MRNGLLTTTLFLSLISGGVLAETVYVHDQLRLGVRGAPDAAEKSIAVVKTGDALEVLGEQDGFIQIRTESGVEGWVSQGYVSPEPPAAILLQAAQQELAKLKNQQTPLQQQLAQAQQKVEQQQQQLAQLTDEKEKLQQQLGQGDAAAEEKAATEGPAKQEPAKQEAGLPHPALIGLMLLMVGLITGLIIGVRWKARRVAERIGGLEI